MKIVSKAVARVSSVPHNQSLLDVDVILQNKYHEIFDLQNKYENYKSEVLDLLHDYNKTIKEKKINNAIQNLRRDMFNQRKIKKKNFDFLDVDLYNTIFQLIDFESVLNQNVESFISIFDNSLNLKLEQLLKIFKHPNIQNGLLLSSHDLLKSTEKKINNSKKRIQLETAMLRYVTRTLFKPTPYSSFTTLNLVEINEGKTVCDFLPNKEIKSFVRLNNYIYRLFIEEILCREEIYIHLYVEINETLILDNKSKNAKVLINKNNLDFFYYFNMSDFASDIVTFLKNKKNIRYHDLLNAFDMYPYEDLLAYINKLVEIGLIKFIYPASGISQDWLNKLVEWLTKIDSSAEVDLMIDVLSNLEQLRNLYEINFDNFSTRLNIIEQARDTINNFVFKNDKSSLMLPKDESLFLEDTLSHSEMRLSKDFLSEKLEKLNFLISFGSSQNFFVRQQKKLLRFFNEYTDKEQIGLLEFYEAYVKKIKSKVPLQDHYEENQNLSDYFDFTSNDSQVAFNFKNREVDFKKNTSFSMFFQIIDNKIIINNIGLGYGRMCSRFFHMFDSSFLNEVKIFNKSLQRKNSFLTEVSDSSFFNANMHPLLFDYECIVPGGHSNSVEENIIGLKELVIKQCKKDDRLILFDEKNQKEIIIHDSSFQGRKARSQMFNFLLNFSDKVFPDFEPILKTINKKYSEKKNGYIFFPRIVFDSNIVLQRKYWLVNTVKLSSFLTKDRISDFFLDVNFWRKENNIPSKVFLKIPEGEENRKDDYKPQFVDFENPIFANLLQKIFRRSSKVILTEFLPFLEADVSNNKDELFTTEYLVQWYNQ